MSTELVAELLLLFALIPAAPVSQAPPVTFTDLATQFDTFQQLTNSMPMLQRIAEFRKTFDQLAPGLYADRDEARLNRRIAASLSEFPSLRLAYRRVVANFPSDLSEAVAHFRTMFPAFSSPFPIVLAHELGTRDGGSDFVGKQQMMLFGADLIARLHNDNSLQPFLEHEVFHLEHARYFEDCDQLWCGLWQEGLATFAASVMTPGATDHQLLLDAPGPIRGPTDARWRQALCWISQRFDSDRDADVDAALKGGSAPPDLPSRFGYYVGLRLATQSNRMKTLPELTQFGERSARHVAVEALRELILAVHAPCTGPTEDAPITHHARHTA